MSPRRVVAGLIAITLALSLVAFPANAGEEREIPLSEVPAPVLEAAKSAVPGIELTAAEVEIEDGVTVYELEGMLEGVEYEIEVTEDGEVLEIEKESEEDEDHEHDDDDHEGHEHDGDENH